MFKSMWYFISLFVLVLGGKILSVTVVHSFLCLSLSQTESHNLAFSCDFVVNIVIKTKLKVVIAKIY